MSICMCKRALPAMILALGLAGCMSPTITNLTPQHASRNATGLYSVEAALDSHQETLLWDTIKPTVVVGSETFPMQPTQLMTNRWETLVPVPSGRNTLSYRIRFDYKYNAFNGPQPDSKLSSVYHLQIIEGSSR